MTIIKRTPNTSGAFPPMQEWNGAIPADWIEVNCDTSIFYTKMGFVTLTISDDVVTAMTANEEAYQAYIDSLPEPEPEQPSELLQTQLALAELAETESAHDLENKLAIAELAETMTGGTDNG